MQLRRPIKRPRHNGALTPGSALWRHSEPKFGRAVQRRCFTVRATPELIGRAYFRPHPAPRSPATSQALSFPIRNTAGSHPPMVTSGSRLMTARPGADNNSRSEFQPSEPSVRIRDNSSGSFLTERKQWFPGLYELRTFRFEFLNRLSLPTPAKAAKPERMPTASVRE